MKPWVPGLLWSERRFLDSPPALPARQAVTSRGALHSCRNLTLLSKNPSPLTFLQLCQVPSGEDCAAGKQPCCPLPVEGEGRAGTRDSPGGKDIHGVWQGARSDADFCWPQPCSVTLLRWSGRENGATRKLLVIGILWIWVSTPNIWWRLALPVPCQPAWQPRAGLGPLLCSFQLLGAGGIGHLPAPQALFSWLAERQLESQTQQDSDNVVDQFWISHHELWDSWLEMLFKSISRHDC